jgi:hypothetical protein
MMKRNLFDIAALVFAACLTIDFAISTPAWAEPTRDAVMDGAARCVGIPDNRVWLDCFYGSAQPMRAVLGLSPAPESQTRLVPGQGTSYGGGAPAPRRAPVVREKPESFLSAMLGTTKPIASKMPMTAYGFGQDGKFTVTMPDGHVWQQVESDIRMARWKRPAAAYKVTINYGSAAGLYDLRVDGEIYKVTRVK